MKFCPNCGSALPNLNSKFCPECGINLQSVSPQDSVIHNEDSAYVAGGLAKGGTDQDEETVRSKVTAYELGRNLEAMVTEIFEKKGWRAVRNYRPPTKSGASTEVDVLLERGNVRKAVECKNFDETRMVGVKDLRDFAYKLRDSGIARGIFVTNSQFSADSESLADSEGIELWDGSKLRETFFASKLGRVVNPSLLQDPVLPLRMEYETASVFLLKNPQSLHLESAVLFYHPYFLIKYRLDTSRKDVTGKRYSVRDEGTYFVDALDGDIINMEHGKLEKITGLLKSKEHRLESKEDKIVSEDLATIKPEKETILKTSDYDLTIAEQVIRDEEAIKIVKNYVVDKNSYDVKYVIKVKGTDETRSMRIAPKASEIEIRGTHMVYVPKWILEYEAGAHTYMRRFVASSDTPIEDNIAKCSVCIVKRQTVAVCDQCGRTLCDKHAFEEGGRWLCPDHISDDLKARIKGNSFVSKVTSFWRIKQ
jgi:hypothetical protein